VLEAGDAGDALTQVTDIAGQIRAAVMDVTLPGMDGPTLAHRLRQLQPALAVLLISGYGDARQRAELDEHFMAKPFDFDALVACVRELIDTGSCKACAPVHLEPHRGASSGSKEA
jgi:CheY-like chemotaxis protein